MVDETALQNYLLKCELQYRAEHADGVERVGWLMEYTKTVKQTARFLRDIGFRVKDIVDDVDCGAIVMLGWSQRLVWWCMLMGVEW